MKTLLKSQILRFTEKAIHPSTPSSLSILLEVF